MLSVVKKWLRPVFLSASAVLAAPDIGVFRADTAMAQSSSSAQTNIITDLQTDIRIWGSGASVTRKPFMLDAYKGSGLSAQGVNVHISSPADIEKMVWYTLIGAKAEYLKFEQSLTEDEKRYKIDGNITVGFKFIGPDGQPVDAIANLTASELKNLGIRPKWDKDAGALIIQRVINEVGLNKMGAAVEVSDKAAPSSGFRLEIRTETDNKVLTIPLNAPSSYGGLKNLMLQDAEQKWVIAFTTGPLKGLPQETLARMDIIYDVNGKNGSYRLPKNQYWPIRLILESGDSFKRVLEASDGHENLTRRDFGETNAHRLDLRP